MNIYGGGANTNKNGLFFEQQTSLKEALKSQLYDVDDNGKVYYNGEEIGLIASKNNLYTKFLQPLYDKLEESIEYWINRGCGEIRISDGEYIYMSAKDIHTLNQRYDAICQYKQKSNKLDWKFYISGQLFPDEAFFNFKNRTLYIIEKKFQNRSGSVDEKLQTCAFKKREYLLLTQDLRLIKYIKNIEYIYICNEWFKQYKYKDVIYYIKKIAKCHIYFNEIPLNFLGLPNC